MVTSWREKQESCQQREVTRPKSSSSLSTHPVPVEAESEAVQLLTHGLDITEEATQSSSVKVRINSEH